MTASQTTRLELWTWESSNDEFTRIQMTDSHEQLEEFAAKFMTGEGAPSVTTDATTKAFYWDTTNGVLYFRGTTSGGSSHSWTQVSHSYDVATQITGNATASAGTGAALARASHVHSVSTATAIDIGATSSTGSGSALALANHIHAIPAGHITNAMISSSAAISSSKISGSVAAADKWNTARTITLAGDLTGSVTFDGSENRTLTAVVVDESHEHASQYQPLDSDLTALAGLATTGFIVRTATGTATTRSLGVSGSGITISNATGVAGDVTITLASASANTASHLVLRDASGNFSAGTITAALSGNATTASSWQTARTITVDGDASGTVSIDGSAAATLTLTVSNAAQASKWTTARTITLSGDASGSVSIDGSSATNTLSATVATATALRTSRTFTFTGDVATANDGSTAVTASFNGSADPSFTLRVKNDSHTHDTRYYTETEIHAAKLYQYANNTSGTGAALPSEAGRTTPRIFVQSTEPTYTSPAVAVTGDIWFQI
jgi:cytoskeletal protein CcmA (bactofilin family)